MLAVIRKMCHARGWGDVDETVDDGFYLTNNDTVLVYLPEQLTKCSVKHVALIKNRMYAYETAACVSVWASPVMSTTQRACDAANIETFTAADLVLDPTEHVLVPKHTRVEDPPAPRALLPHMKRTDPVARWYGWPVGTVVRIDRSEEEVYYRVVVA